MAPLVSRPVLLRLGTIIALVLFVCWWSFAPAPDFLLLLVILLTGWVVIWASSQLLLRMQMHRWSPFRAAAGRQRGRDSRVSQLRALLQDLDRGERVSELHTILQAITTDRLAARGVDPATDPEQVQALLGADLRTYLRDPAAYRLRGAHDVEQLLHRIERI